jgi:hypothetical protein
MTTRPMSSHESSCLPNCRPLNVSPRLLLDFVQSVQEASVRACSQFHGWHSQRSPCCSLYCLRVRDIASCIAGSNHFRLPSVTDTQLKSYNYIVICSKSDDHYQIAKCFDDLYLFHLYAYHMHAQGVMHNHLSTQ